MVSLDVINMDCLSLCTDEESDDNMLCMLRSEPSRNKTIIIQTVDTDAVVLADIFAQILGFERLVVAIGTWISFRYIDVTGRS